jgi:hypothetical protein
MFLIIGVVLLSLLLTCSGEETGENLSSPSPMEEKDDYSKGIKSGIVFKDRGRVLITGESWTVAKEFNVTQVSLLIQEARNLLPDIRRKLENASSRGENAWDLSIFHDAIIQEIEVVEPIINKIENKVRIFENMLPKAETDSSKDSSRNKRAIGSLVTGFLTGIGGAVAEVAFKWLFGSKEDREVRALNEKYEKMRYYQHAMKQQLYQQALKLSYLAEEVAENTEDIKRLEAELDKHFTIINDLETKTRENRRSIKIMYTYIEWAINEWLESRKELAQKLNFVVNVTSTLRMMEIKLLSIDTDLTGLLEALDTTSTGRLSPNLISPSRLVEILRDVSKNLPEGVYPLTHIEEDAVYEYYTHASVQAIAIPSAIRVFVKLPLKSSNRIFYLFEPYSLPFYHQKAGVFLEIAKPSDYILVSKDMQKVAEIPARVLNECRKKGDLYLCIPSFPLYEGTKCSLSLIKGDEEEIIKSCERKVVVPNFHSTWIRTDGGWIYSVPRTTRLTRMREGEPPKMLRINGTGVLEDLPHTYTYSSDGTVLFPNDNLGQESENLSSVEDVRVPVVPDLLLLNESSRMQQEDLYGLIGNLSKSNFDMQKVNLEHVLSFVRAQALTLETKEMTGHFAIPMLAIAVIVNYAVLGFMCWSKTKKNFMSLKRNSAETEEASV